MNQVSQNANFILHRDQGSFKLTETFLLYHDKAAVLILTNGCDTFFTCPKPYRI